MRVGEQHIICWLFDMRWAQTRQQHNHCKQQQVMHHRKHAWTVFRTCLREAWHHFHDLQPSHVVDALPLRQEVRQIELVVLQALKRHIRIFFLCSFKNRVNVKCSHW